MRRVCGKWTREGFLGGAVRGCGTEGLWACEPRLARRLRRAFGRDLPGSGDGVGDGRTCSAWAAGGAGGRGLRSLECIACVSVCTLERQGAAGTGRGLLGGTRQTGGVQSNMPGVGARRRRVWVVAPCCMWRDEAHVFRVPRSDGRREMSVGSAEPYFGSCNVGNVCLLSNYPQSLRRELKRCTRETLPYGQRSHVFWRARER